jgi:hypothetical protein
VACCQIEQVAHYAGHQLRNAVAFRAQPQPHVERYLLVAAAAGVDLFGQRAHPRLQLADDERVHVLVAGPFEVRLRADLLEGCDDARAFLGAEDPDPLQRPREGLRAANIRVEQAAVEMERTREALEHFRGPRFEPAAPELHADCLAASAARTLMGRPMRLMKPSASFWS